MARLATPFVTGGLPSISVKKTPISRTIRISAGRHSTAPT
jgi:hypothetical protein